MGVSGQQMGSGLYIEHKTKRAANSVMRKTSLRALPKRKTGLDSPVEPENDPTS